MSYKSLALVMTAIAGVSTSILFYLLAFRGQECRRLLSTESTKQQQQQRKGRVGRIDFRKILGKIPEATLDIPFPYNEQKVVKYIRQKLCPKAVPACSSSESSTTSATSSSSLSFFANTIHGDIKVLLDSNHTVTLDDIASGYTRAMEAFVSYSFTHFLGVPMQQGPKDAFALMDLIWRVKPDLLIEFGTRRWFCIFLWFNHVCLQSSSTCDYDGPRSSSRLEQMGCEKNMSTLCTCTRYPFLETFGGHRIHT